jgi:hypothetical protein
MKLLCQWRGVAKSTALSGFLLLSRNAFAEEASTPPAGVAVLAVAGAEAPARFAAKEVYAVDGLRPTTLGEARARALVGEAVKGDVAPEVRELSEERSGVRGDDGASRALLRGIAEQLDVRALVVIDVLPAGGSRARVFLVAAGAFDAAVYGPDAPTVNAPAGVVRWTAMVASLGRTFGPLPLRAVAAVATQSATSPSSASHPFYTSPWFWAAVGTAVLGGAAVYLYAKDTNVSPSTGIIGLQIAISR